MGEGIEKINKKVSISIWDELLLLFKRYMIRVKGQVKRNKRLKIGIRDLASILFKSESFSNWTLLTFVLLKVSKHLKINCYLQTLILVGIVKIIGLNIEYNNWSYVTLLNKFQIVLAKQTENIELTT